MPDRERDRARASETARKTHTQEEHAAKQLGVTREEHVDTSAHRQRETQLRKKGEWGR